MSIDLRQKVLSGDIKFRKKGLWVDAWEAWVMVQELTGEERSALIEANFNLKTKKINQKTLYPHLVIVSTRYVDADCVVDPVEVKELDENGDEVTRTIPHPHLPEFMALMQNVASDPQAGQLIFQLPDRDNLNKTSGAVLELVAQVASRLSGLLPEQSESKKSTSGETMTTGTIVEAAPSAASTTASPEPSVA